jgi:hypothetical protein
MSKNEIALVDEPSADENLSDASEELDEEDESTSEPMSESTPELGPEPVPELTDAEVTDAEVTHARPADPGPAVSPESPESLALGTSSFFTQLGTLGELRAAMDALPHEDTAGVGDITAQVAANRLNALKSTGPRTAAGKRRSRMNALKSYSGRLTGAAQTVSLRLEAGGAERLYEELVRPYQRADRPVPAMLAIHFHDLARLRLELETWERIRDAEMEEQWRQGKIERRRRLHELMKDLPLTNEEAIEKGLQGLPESAAKAKKTAEDLSLLQARLAHRKFDFDPILTALYGKEHNPNTDEGVIICMQCDRLLKSRKGNGLSDDEFKQLLRLVAIEARNAVAGYTLYLDQATMPEAACVARLKLTREDRAMSLHGERLRQAIDRKQWVIIGLLQALGLTRGQPSSEDENPEEGPLPPMKICKTKPKSRLESTKRPRKTSKTKPNKRLKTP